MGGNDPVFCCDVSLTCDRIDGQGGGRGCDVKVYLSP